MLQTQTEPSTERVELPVVYRRATAYFAAFPCALSAFEGLVPSADLRPLSVWPGTGALVVAVFDYQDTSIGPYGEVGIGIPCRRSVHLAPPLLPLLAERWLEDVG